MTTIPLVHVDAEDAPVACALNATEFEDRTARLSDLAARSLTDRTPIEGGERLTFVDVPAVEREVRAAIDAESSCCSFLSMRLMRTEDSLVLDITGTAQARPVIAELFAPGRMRELGIAQKAGRSRGARRRALPSASEARRGSLAVRSRFGRHQAPIAQLDRATPS